MPVEFAGDLSLARIGNSLEQRHAADDHAGRAVTTLHRVSLDKSFLNGMQFSILFQAFDGGDLFPLSLAHGSDARTYRSPIQQDCASAALAFAAAILGSSKVEFFAEDVEERPLGIGLDSTPGSVDDQFHTTIILAVL